MDPHALTTGEWLADRLDDPAVRILQVTNEPDIDDYSDGHIPGARRIWWKDLLWDDYERQFPTPAQLAERLGRLGVGPETTLVLYSGRNHYAMYGFWLPIQVNAPCSSATWSGRHCLPRHTGCSDDADPASACRSWNARRSILAW